MGNSVVVASLNLLDISPSLVSPNIQREIEIDQARHFCQDLLAISVTRQLRVRQLPQPYQKSAGTACHTLEHSCLKYIIKYDESISNGWIVQWQK